MVMMTLLPEDCSSSLVSGFFAVRMKNHMTGFTGIRWQMRVSVLWKYPERICLSGSLSMGKSMAMNMLKDSAMR